MTDQQNLAFQTTLKAASKNSSNRFQFRNISGSDESVVEKNNETTAISRTRPFLIQWAKHSQIPGASTLTINSPVQKSSNEALSSPSPNSHMPSTSTPYYDSEIGIIDNVNVNVADEILKPFNLSLCETDSDIELLSCQPSKISRQERTIHGVAKTPSVFSEIDITNDTAERIALRDALPGTSCGNKERERKRKRKTPAAAVVISGTDTLGNIMADLDINSVISEEDAQKISIMDINMALNHQLPPNLESEFEEFVNVCKSYSVKM